MAELDLPRSSLLTKYRDSMQELQETLVKEKKWRQDAENENRLLRKRNLEIEEQITDFRYSSVEYVAKLEDLSGENKKLNERNKDYQDHINKLEEMLERQQVRTETLEKEVEKLEDLTNDLKSELSDKQRTLEDWKNSFIHYEEQVKLTEHENFQIKEECAAYQKAYKELEYGLNIKERELNEIFQTYKLLEKENTKLKEQENWVSENQKITELKTQQIIEDEKKITQGFKAKLSALNENLEILKVEKEKWEDFARQAKQENCSLNDLILELKKNNEEVEKSFAGKISQMQERLIHIEQSYEEKEKNNSSLNSEIKLQTEKFLNLQVEYCSVKESLAEKIKEINLVKNELHNKNESIFEVTLKNKELVSQIQNLSETIEQEKIKHSKDLQKLSNKYEHEIEGLKLTASSEIEFEISKKNQEVQELHDRFENYLKGKDEEVIILNSDREKLQEMLKELDNKLRELLNKYQNDCVNWENLQKNLKEETNSRISFENRYNAVLCRITELENQVQNSSEIIAELKGQIKTSKKQFQADSEGFLKASKDKIEFWKQKFREEVGYLEKWAQSIEGDSGLAVVYKRIVNIVGRLENVLDYSEE